MGRKRIRCNECNKRKATFRCVDCGTLYCMECAELVDMQCDCTEDNIQPLPIGDLDGTR